MKKIILSLLLLTSIVQAKDIVAIQYGVIDGKTGKSAVYVYLKSKTDSTFNVTTDRVTIFTENMFLLKQTVEYKRYLIKKRSK